MIDFLSTKVKFINESNVKCFVAVTGGGQSFFTEFMQYSGASKTIVGGLIPYGKEQLTNFCGYEPKQYCSSSTALRMATKAFEQGSKGIDSNDLVGIGVTCSLTTDGEREGRTHRLFIGAHTKKQSWVLTGVFYFGTSRGDQEQFISRAIINILQHQAQCGSLPPVEMFKGSTIADVLVDSVKVSDFVTVDEFKDFSAIAVYPGSWHPFHKGHFEITQLAEQILNVPVKYELTIQNADKGVVDLFEIKERVDKLPRPCIVSHATTFLDKATELSQVSKHIIFIIGADTWVRIQQPEYAGDINELYHKFKAMNVKFLVFKRLDFPIRTYSYLDDLLILHDDALNFNTVISSTEIRAALGMSK